MSTSTARSFRKKPVVIQAMQMPETEDQNAVRAVGAWMVDQGYEDASGAGQGFDPTEHDEMYAHGELLLPDYGSNFLEIETLEGTMTARPGDYVIQGVGGEFYPCKPDIFEQTYEPAP